MKIGLSDYHLLLCLSSENGAMYAVPIGSNFFVTHKFIEIFQFPVFFLQHFPLCLTHVFIMFCLSAMTLQKLHLVFVSTSLDFFNLRAIVLVGCLNITRSTSESRNYSRLGRPSLPRLYT